MEENIVNQTTLENPIVEEKLNDVNEVEITSSEENTLDETDEIAVSQINLITEADTVVAESEEIKTIITDEFPEAAIAEEVAPVDSVEDGEIEKDAGLEKEAELENSPEIEAVQDGEIKEVAELEKELEIEAVQEVAVEVESPLVAEIEPKPTKEIAQAEIEAEHETLEAIETYASHQKVDYASLSKTELLEILEKSLAAVKSESPTNVDFKKADTQLKDIKPIFDALKSSERTEAFEKFKAENESEDGFEYKENEETAKFDQLYKKIKEAKYAHFTSQEKSKENNFTKKTELLNQLRVLADSEDGNISTVKANIVSLKKLQQDWKDAGNVASPHNNILWQTYHALVDRFYSNRSIYFELLELDRKKNLNLKVELCNKVEIIAAKIQEEELTNKHLQEAAHIYEEYKHVGPATKEANELLWNRFKAALDIIYDKRRSQLDALKGTFEENLAAKTKVLESLALFTSFKSESINEWMEQTKAIDILQKQWDEIKGPLPKDKTREISKDFWNGVKLFYRNKGEFFKQLEAKRDENLKLKQSLCEQAESFLATEEDTPENTKAVIKLQEDWRKIGHVPDKFRNKIYERFKAACDAYFNKKRQKSNDSEKVYVENLQKKIALCEKIEKDAKAGADLSQLAEIKKEWATIGFVPKAEMQAIQKRYIDAINSYVGSLGKLSDKEKEKLTLQTEVEVFKQRDGGSAKDLGRKENDIRAKMQALENDLSTLKNNLEFFGRSKNADKIKADFEQKIKKGEEDLAHMKHQLKVVRQAAD